MNTITQEPGRLDQNSLFIKGKSTDEKPVDSFNGVAIINGSEYKEIDTGNMYTFDSDTKTWFFNGSSGSGSGGANGITPHIGSNGNWFIGSTDTGVQAEGTDGGYYIPVVTQPSTDKLQISFMPSNSEMPSVQPVTVDLPGSDPGHDATSLTLTSPNGAKWSVIVGDDGKIYTRLQSGPSEPEGVACNIANHLTNVTTDNSAASVPLNTPYSAILTPVEGYVLDAVTVTMGGVDITASVYADGVINIPAVTGHVVITAAAVEESTEDITQIGSTLRIVRTATEPVQLGHTLRIT